MRRPVVRLCVRGINIIYRSYQRGVFNVNKRVAVRRELVVRSFSKHDSWRADGGGPGNGETDRIKKENAFKHVSFSGDPPSRTESKPECARRVTRDGMKFPSHHNVNRAGEHAGTNGENSVVSISYDKTR